MRYFTNNINSNSNASTPTCQPGSLAGRWLWLAQGNTRKEGKEALLKQREQKIKCFIAECKRAEGNVYALKVICWNWMERIHLVKEKKKIIMSLSLSWKEEEDKEVWRRDCGEWNYEMQKKSLRKERKNFFAFAFDVNVIWWCGNVECIPLKSNTSSVTFMWMRSALWLYLMLMRSFFR